jgi:hypothetical protein
MGDNHRIHGGLKVERTNAQEIKNQVAAIDAIKKAFDTGRYSGGLPDVAKDLVGVLTIRVGNIVYRIVSKEWPDKADDKTRS